MDTENSWLDMWMDDWLDGWIKKKVGGQTCVWMAGYMVGSRR